MAEQRPMNDWIDAELRVERAHDLYEKGRWAEAAAELRAAIEVNPLNASWHFNLALTLEAMDDHQRACQAYRSALKIEPNDLEALNCLGVNLTRAGGLQDALRCFERIEAVDATYEPGYCNRIITYTEMGDHDQAEVMFYLARQFKDHCALCCYNIGNSFYARKQYDRAISCYEQALAIDAEHPQARARIADAYWAKGMPDRAKQYYRAELRQDPGDVETLLDFGELLMEQGEYDHAGEMFRRVLEQVPDHAAAHFCVGELASKQGDPASAEEQFRLVLQIDRSYSGAHARLGELMLRRGKVKAAVKHLLAELKTCGEDLAMLQEVGQLLLESQQTRFANIVLQRLVRLRPQDAQAQHNLAVSYFMLKRIDEGILHCRRALKIRPDYALALYNLALAHLQKGQVPRARRYVARALTVDPRNDQVRRLCRKLGMTGLWTRLRSRLFGRPKPMRP